MNLHQNKPPTWWVHIPGHPWVLGQATGTLDNETHHGPDSGEATTFPHIVFSVTPRWDYIQMALFPGTPKLESRNCPETVMGGVPGLWELITPEFGVWSRQGLNQTCSPRWDLSNDVSNFQFEGWEEVDSRLLVVGNQTASLTPVWLPALLLPITWATDVQMTNARPFSISTLRNLSNDTKNTSMRGVLGLAVELWSFGSPGRLQILTFSKCWASPPHLAKVGLWQTNYLGSLGPCGFLLGLCSINVPSFLKP
jgi:hypothetical protein